MNGIDWLKRIFARTTDEANQNALDAADQQRKAVDAKRKLRDEERRLQEGLSDTPPGETDKVRRPYDPADDDDGRPRE